MEKQCNLPTTILVADDDEDDRLLIKDAFSNSCQCVKLTFLKDGVSLIDYLDAEKAIKPALIMLDLNMPRMNGIQALEILKSDSRLKDIPVIILTTSSEDDIIAETYCKGASSFIRKPQLFSELEQIVSIVSQYWCKIVLLPRKADCEFRTGSA